METVPCIYQRHQLVVVSLTMTTSNGKIIERVFIMYIFCFFSALCPTPTTPNNGMITGNGNSIGNAIAFTCNIGFEISGSALATCTLLNPNSAEFRPDSPICIRKSTFYVAMIYI